jgi:hypothetical protein
VVNPGSTLGSLPLDRGLLEFHRPPLKEGTAMFKRFVCLLLSVSIPALAATMATAAPAGNPDGLTLGYYGQGDVREIAYRPWGPAFIFRRYCSAKVHVSDRVRPTLVYYSIGSNTGFAGASWGLEWCVVGYDRNLAYAPSCRAARP